MNAPGKKEGREEDGDRRRLSAANLSSLGLRGGTHAYLAGPGSFWVYAMEAAGLFGNSPVSGVLGPVTRGPRELAGGPADQSSSKYCSKLIDATPGREGAGIFHT